MQNLLAPRGPAATAAAPCVPTSARAHHDRTAGLALAGLLLTAGAAIGTLALTATDSTNERGFGGLSDVKTVRNVQLPTL